MAFNSIMQVFAKSPITPLQQHISVVKECCDLLIPFFHACYANDWELSLTIQKNLSEKERAADKLKREIRLNLPKGLFMPIARTDLLELLTQQDKLADRAKDVAGRVIGRKLSIPIECRDEFLIYVQRCLDAANQAHSVINELDELLTTGFKGREVDLVESMIDELDTIEDDTDRLQISLRRHLMHVETQYNPIDMMFLYKVLEWIGDIADQALRVGSRLELMMSRS